LVKLLQQIIVFMRKYGIVPSLKSMILTYMLEFKK